MKLALCQLRQALQPTARILGRGAIDPSCHIDRSDSCPAVRCEAKQRLWAKHKERPWAAEPKLHRDAMKASLFAKQFCRILRFEWKAPESVWVNKQGRCVLGVSCKNALLFLFPTKGPGPTCHHLSQFPKHLSEVYVLVQKLDLRTFNALISACGHWKTAAGGRSLRDKDWNGHASKHTWSIAELSISMCQKVFCNCVTSTSGSQMEWEAIDPWQEHVRCIRVQRVWARPKSSSAWIQPAKVPMYSLQRDQTDNNYN